MFQISEADHLAIRAIYEDNGLLAAALELRCRYPDIASHTLAVEYVLSLACWKPLPELPRCLGVS